MGDEATGTAGGVGEAPQGIDRAGVEAWFERHVPGVELPLSFDRISGGHSNLTYGVSDAAADRWALRRPPLGKRLGSAHDMGREHKVVSALGATDVPVAPVVGICEDESVNEAPFYVMEFVEGPILRGLAEAEVFPDEADRRAIGERVVDTLVGIHAVDPDAVGLGDLGRKEDYVARQLHRWQGQWEKSKTRELATIDDVHERLAARIPEQGPATIVHGDYRLDNMILTAEGEVAAVVDWELCTLGDPLADVGLLMVYWPERDQDVIALGQPANLAPGFPTRDELSLSSTSSSPSATGSWRSSSRASTPATPPASTARPTRASTTSRRSSSSSPRRRRRPSGETDRRGAASRRLAGPLLLPGCLVVPFEAGLTSAGARPVNQGEPVNKIRKRLTYANVMSSIAVFLILGGATAIAANKVPKKSVGTVQLKANAVTTAKLKRSSVTTTKLKDGSVVTNKLANAAVSNAKIADNAVTGDKVNEASLSEVPSASSANPVVFAHVETNGDLDANNSKGLTAANVVKKGEGEYCITVPGFNPRGGQVTPQFGGTAGTTATLNVGTGLCPAPQVQVLTFAGEPAAKSSLPFYVMLYH